MNSQKLKTFILQWNHYTQNSCHLERGKQDFIEYAAEEILGGELKSKFYEVLPESEFVNDKLEVTNIDDFIATLIKPGKVMCYLTKSLMDENEWLISRASDDKLIDVLNDQQAAEIEHKNSHFLWQPPGKA